MSFVPIANRLFHVASQWGDKPDLGYLEDRLLHFAVQVAFVGYDFAITDGVFGQILEIGAVMGTPCGEA